MIFKIVAAEIMAVMADKIDFFRFGLLQFDIWSKFGVLGYFSITKKTQIESSEKDFFGQSVQSCFISKETTEIAVTRRMFRSDKVW